MKRWLCQLPCQAGKTGKFCPIYYCKYCGAMKNKHSQTNNLCAPTPNGKVRVPQ